MMRERFITSSGALAVVLFICLWLLPSGACGGVVFDGTIGTPGALPGPDYRITADRGATAGNNLFHSFSTFDIARGESATFSGPSFISNIISRITGGSLSTIDGTISSSIAGANLYMINPAGIVFGPNATLDVSGSFHAGTAHYLRFSDGALFSASNPSPGVLTSAPVSAFGFLTSSPAAISVHGAGSLKGEQDYGLKGLSVPAGRDLSLMGGDIAITSGLLGGSDEVESRIRAPGGRVNIVSVASPGEVAPIAGGMDVGSFAKLGDINILKGSRVTVSDTSAGNIYIRGGNFVLDSGSLPPSTPSAGGLFADSSGEATGGGIDVRLSGNLVVANGAVIAGNNAAAGIGSKISLEALDIRFSSGGNVTCLNSGTGPGADVSVTVQETLDISGYSTSGSSGISISTDGAGDAGHLTVQAKSIHMDDYGRIDGSNHSDSAVSRGADLSLNANHITLTNGGIVTTETTGKGQGGRISLNASDSLTISGPGSMIYAGTSGEGAGGDIAIAASRLTVSDGGVISATAFDAGKGGSIQITAAEAVEIKGVSGGYYSYVGAQSQGSGDGGNISIAAPRLTVSDGGVISTNAYGAGKGGSIALTASEAVEIKGVADDYYYSYIEAESNGAGDGGNIIIAAPRFLAGDGGGVSATAFDNGRSGSIQITAAESVEVKGTTGDFYSWIAIRSHGSGDSGNISITAPRLTVSDGGVISASAFGSGKGGSIALTASESVEVKGVAGDYYSYIEAESHGAGDGGNIVINVPRFMAGDGGGISATAFDSGRGGSIQITATESVEVRGTTGDLYSWIAARSHGAGDGGNISITAPRLIVSDGGVISASAFGSGKGGSISLTASETVEITGVTGAYYSYIEAESGGAGDGGNIVITAPRFMACNGGGISANAFDAGRGGSIQITATESAEVKGATGDLYSWIAVRSHGAGDGGNISITAPRLTVSDSGTISATTFGAGQSGSIAINATEAVEVSGLNGDFFTGIAAQSQGPGAGGDISITTRHLTVANGGAISASAYSSGKGGSITLAASEAVDVKGAIGPNCASIDAESNSTGDGGNISITTPHLTVAQGGDISAKAAGAGMGGSITVASSGSVLVSGSNAFIRAGTTGSGRGGAVFIRAPHVRLNNDGQISVSTSSTGSGGDVFVTADSLELYSGAAISSESSGTGTAGNIHLQTGRELLMNRGRITTGTTDADGGSIYIHNGWLIDMQDSSITATVMGGTGNGGNIFMESRDIVVDPSQIIAKAEYGNGGNIFIISDALVVDTGSVISASSKYGNNGNVRINSPVVDLVGNLMITSDGFLGTDTLSPRHCIPLEAGETSSFRIVGRDGLPPPPAPEF